MTTNKRASKTRHGANRLDLEALGKKLLKLDRRLIVTLRQRMDLARKVEEWKSLGEVKPDKQGIIRPDVEEKRLAQFAEHARELGVDPNFARTILWAIIAESCRIQIKQREDRKVNSVVSH